jgi:hypothetical protein
MSDPAGPLPPPARPVAAPLPLQPGRSLAFRAPRDAWHGAPLAARAGAAFHFDASPARAGTPAA